MRNQGFHLGHKCEARDPPRQGWQACSSSRISWGKQWSCLSGAHPLLARPQGWAALSTGGSFLPLTEQDCDKALLLLTEALSPGVIPGQLRARLVRPRGMVCRDLPTRPLLAFAAFPEPLL